MVSSCMMKICLNSQCFLFCFLGTNKGPMAFSTTALPPPPPSHPASQPPLPASHPTQLPAPSLPPRNIKPPLDLK